MVTMSGPAAHGRGRQGAPWGKWQPEGFWFPKSWFESRRGSVSRSGGVVGQEGFSGAAIVLAAGRGRRMKSVRPKVLHAAAGRPLLIHVLAALAPLRPSGGTVVVAPAGGGVEAVVEAFDPSVKCVVQEPPRGTGDAVRAALGGLSPEVSSVLVTAGDTPLLRASTLSELLRATAGDACAAALLTADLEDPSGYGRVVRSSDGEVLSIVEDRDATEAQRGIHEINAGTYLFDVARLRDALAEVTWTHGHDELYLTDVFALLRGAGERVVACRADAEDVAGVNSRSQLAGVSRVLRRRVAEHWMAEGVTIVDPTTTYIDATVSIASDVVLQPFTFLEGETSVAEGCVVGPQARIAESRLEEDATVSFSVVVGATIGPGATVGPFASIRPGTTLQRGVKVGTFVETKQTTIGEGSKVNHLAYLGDADIGADVNVGAGTITCNWDGRSKHPTAIEDEAYIGSDTMLVAPVKIGRRAATGAGAVVRQDVPDDALAVGVPARLIEGRGRKLTSRRSPDGPGPEPEE